MPKRFREASGTALQSGPDNGLPSLFADKAPIAPFSRRPTPPCMYEAARQEAAARGHTITHRRLAIPDMGTPAPAQMSEILDTIDAALEERETTYVHCFGGIGRTGAVIGCWLVRHGLSGKEALAQIAAWRAGTPGKTVAGNGGAAADGSHLAEGA